MRGSTIPIAVPPGGVFLSGIAGDTSVPGTVMGVQAATAMIGTLFTFAAQSVATAGNQVISCILLAQDEFGQLTGVNSVVGTAIRMYVPRAGEDINVLCAESSGTGNQYNIGDRLILNTVGGWLIEATGSPQEVPYNCMETIHITGQGLVWCRRT